MYCKNCGKENSNDAKFCSYCGHELEHDEIKVEIVDDYGSTNKGEEAKCWAIFAQVGKILGIISLACCWIPGLGSATGIHGIVFSALGRRSEKEIAKVDSILGLKLSIIGTALSVTFSIVYAIVAAIANIR